MLFLIKTRQAAWKKDFTHRESAFHSNIIMLRKKHMNCPHKQQYLLVPNRACETSQAHVISFIAHSHPCFLGR